MTFTPLELLLINMVTAIIVAIFIRMRSVSTKECKEHREAFASQCSTQHTATGVKFNVIFRMLRVLVVYQKDIPDKERAEILNTKGDD